MEKSIISKKEFKKLMKGNELDCVNIIAQGEGCMVTISTLDDDDIIFNVTTTENLVEAIFHAEDLSIRYDLPMKLYLNHIVFKEEYPSRYLTRIG
ncbi:hypothetical protein [Bacillus sp. Marseille-Q1617]|uniref:hypothetical protein n=1 Tax=Bacillus sp. Marseille-Q1617 TaxID=2736887 RepID=UPI00158B2CC8|nr:hypothetical protein [Bacillus sp. Marseille-Q1617]